MSDDPSASGRRRVRRGEGEVTEWPRSLVEYTPKGPEEAKPSPEEDRDLNRLRLAARLAGVLQSRGRPVEDALERLRHAERAFRKGARAEGRRWVNEAMDLLERDANARP